VIAEDMRRKRMNRSLAVALCLVLTAFAGGDAWAKIAAPKPVKPVVDDGVKYLAPNRNGREGLVEARKADTGEKLWDAVIYTVKINPDLEEDVQWVFITKLEIAGDKLLVTNDKGEQYKLDLKTRKVEKVEKDAGKDK
jgi:tricorn protease-like protein